ncbi:MAG: MCE family protein [Chromatiaceae bacterium]|nr:MAG: MCE family protein [Chromatiaceae bacterium]
MEPRAHHVVIGLFTLLTFLAALVFGLWLHKTASDREYEYYEIVFTRAVSGLAEGNMVQFSGIRVGDVMDLSLNPDDPNEVRVLVRVDSEIPVHADTRATLKLVNITGAMSVQLYGGTPDTPRLEGSRSSPPRIEGDPSPLNTLLDESETLIEAVGQLLHNANRMVSTDNADTVTRILDDVEKVTSALAGQSGDLASAMGAITQASLQAEKTLVSLQRLGDEAHTLLGGEGRAILDHARKTMASVEATASRMESLLATHEGSLDQGLQSFGELDPAMRELKSTLRNLNRVIRRLEDNPTRFLIGQDSIQEFNP